MDLQQAQQIVQNNKRNLFNSIKDGTHPQFVFNKEIGRVMCKCGGVAVQLRDGLLCSSITARPCKY